MFDYFFDIFPDFARWYLPVFWMFLFILRTGKYNYIYNILYKLFLPFSIMYWCFFASTASALYLMMFYASLGLTFIYYLINIRKWNFPQAMSIGTICALIGSYYWEFPFLIYNAFTRGFELDWILHLTGLMFFWFVWKSVGWNKDRITLVVVSLGAILAICFMVFGPITTMETDYVIWNSLHFMTIRFICTLITFYAVNKSIPVVVKK
jgi:hypothetical protein